MENSLDKLTKKFLQQITSEDIQDFSVFSHEKFLGIKIKAYSYLNECHLKELPKYINNPYPQAQAIITRRLQGAPLK